MSFPSDFQAAVFDGTGSKLRLGKFSLPRLKVGEVLVRVSCCTLCGSDFHTYMGRRTGNSPSILGHEIVGIIEDVAMNGGAVLDQYGRPVQPGDRITWSLVVSCGSCRLCRRSLPQKCELLFKYGHERFLAGDSPSGGVSQYCVLRPGTAIFPVSSLIPDATAGMASCAAATVCAVLRSAGPVEDGTSVLIQGAGMLGLVAGAMLRQKGASIIAVVDPDPVRLQTAVSFGASHAVGGYGSSEEIGEQLDRITDRRGFDIALELSGNSSAMEVALPLLAVGGRYVLAGAVYPSRPVNLNAEIVVRKMLHLIGVHNYEAQDLGTALNFLADQATTCNKFESLIDARFTLDKVNEAFEYGQNVRPARVAILPN